MLTLIQFGLNTSDLAASLRLYSEAFGFQNAGAQGLWGESIRVQGLPPESRALLWWMVGSQPLFQLELFHHTRPVQRPLPKAWRPCDHGWVRFGISVCDLDRCISVIKSNNLEIISQTTDVNGRGRIVFFDPYVGLMIDVCENAHLTGPAAIYATSSVADLEGARSFYRDVLGFTIAPLERLHTPEDEALWGLLDARRTGFVVDAGVALLEIVQYEYPVSRPRRHDRMASDQGFGNVAFGSRDKSVISAALERLHAAGIEPTSTFQTEELLAAYIVDPDKETELAVIPEGFDAVLGFSALQSFFG